MARLSESATRLRFIFIFQIRLYFFFTNIIKRKKGFWKQSLSFYGETNADVQMDTWAGCVQATFLNFISKLYHKRDTSIKIK